MTFDASQQIDHTLWLLTGIDGDEWDDISWSAATLQGSRLGTTLDKPPRHVELIRHARQGHHRRRYYGNPTPPANKGGKL